MDKKIVKNKLRDRSCDNCKYLGVSNKERTKYEKDWDDYMPVNWCWAYKEKPKHNVCMHWEIEDGGLMFNTSTDDNGIMKLSLTGVALRMNSHMSSKS